MLVSELIPLIEAKNLTPTLSEDRYCLFYFIVKENWNNNVKKNL